MGLGMFLSGRAFAWHVQVFTFSPECPITYTCTHRTLIKLEANNLCVQFSHFKSSMRWRFNSSCLLHSPMYVCIYREGIPSAHFCKQKMLQYFILNPALLCFLSKRNNQILIHISSCSSKIYRHLLSMFSVPTQRVMNMGFINEHPMTFSIHFEPVSSRPLETILHADWRQLCCC